MKTNYGDRFKPLSRLFNLKEGKAACCYNPVPIECEFIQKRRQRSSRLFGGP